MRRILVQRLIDTPIIVLTLRGATANFCGQKDQYQQRGGEDLYRQNGRVVFWYSKKLGNTPLLSSQWQIYGGVQRLSLSFKPTTTYPVVTVTFLNDDVATYYSPDGKLCEVKITNAAADVKSVTARP